MFWIVLILAIIVLLYVLSQSGPIKKETIINIDVPNPERCEDKTMIDFIESTFCHILEPIFKEYINKGLIIKPIYLEAYYEKMNKSSIEKKKYYDLLNIPYKKKSYEPRKTKKTNGNVEIIITITGVSFSNRNVYILSNCNEGDEVILREESTNKYDNNAIAIYHQKKKIGYVDKNETKRFINRLNYCKSRIIKITNEDNFLNVKVKVDVNVPDRKSVV